MIDIKPISISKEETNKLIKEYRSSDCEIRKMEIEELIIRAYFKLVVKLSNRYSRAKNHDYDDYIMIGCCSLIKSMQSFSDKDSSYITYAYKMIRWDLISYKQRKSNLVYNKTTKDDDGNYNYLNLDAIIESIEDDSNPHDEIKWIPPISEFARRANLTKKQESIFLARMKGETLREIGERIGISTSAVSTSHQSAINKITKYFQTKLVIGDK